jgi:hypothetical protein
MDEKNDKRTRIGITILPEAIRQADEHIKIAGCKSRSEFIERAIARYAGYTAAQKNADYIAEAVSDEIRGIVKSAEERIARQEFKVAAELAKIVRMIAPLCEVDGEELRKLHFNCVEEVKRINGILKLDSVIRDEY